MAAWLCWGTWRLKLRSEHPCGAVPCTGAGWAWMLQLGWHHQDPLLAWDGVRWPGGGETEKPCEEERGELAPAKTLQLSRPLVPACAAGGCLPSWCGTGC